MVLCHLTYQETCKKMGRLGRFWKLPVKQQALRVSAKNVTLQACRHTRTEIRRHSGSQMHWHAAARAPTRQLNSADGVTLRPISY